MAAQASGVRDALLSLAQDLKKLARYEKNGNGTQRRKD